MEPLPSQSLPGVWASEDDEEALAAGLGKKKGLASAESQTMLLYASPVPEENPDKPEVGFIRALPWDGGRGG